MRSIVGIGAALALLLSVSANAGTLGEGTDLLSQATVGAASTVEPLTLAQLADVRGEGTIDRFIELPRLHRSFERTVSLDNGLSVAIVGVAGEGIHITVTNPHIP
jgi:hypothetical protein